MKTKMTLSILFLIGSFCQPTYADSTATQDPQVWKDWIQYQVAHHPTMLAARESLNAAQSSAEGLRQPLFNPELETEFEREGDDDNYRFGLNQTIDWSDKLGARTQQAKFIGQYAEFNYRAQYQSQIARSLTALVQWHIAHQKSTIATEQQALLTRLLDVIQQRHRTGDLGQAEANLAYMALSQRLKFTADAEADMLRAEADLMTLLPAWRKQSTLSTIPEAFWRWKVATDPTQLARQHPDVATAERRWQALKAGAELARREQHADPSFGINAGRENDENTVGVSFSIPLYVRNDFSAQARAASQAALSAEAEYQAAYLQQSHLINSSRSIQGQYQKHYQQWRNLVKSHTANGTNLIARQWLTGDLSTTDYVQMLNQYAEGVLASIQLERDWKLAVIEYLSHAGMLEQAITSM